MHFFPHPVKMELGDKLEKGGAGQGLKLWERPFAKYATEDSGGLWNLARAPNAAWLQWACLFRLSSIMLLSPRLTGRQFSRTIA
jgi:hypothetical protein